MLNKAKRFRQLDLKKSVIKKTGLSQEEVEELQRRAEEERRRWQEVWEEEKKRRREERMERLKALQEKKRLEKLRQRELMKPREDTLFTDSKVSITHPLTVNTLSLSLPPQPLPVPSPVCSQLPQELFGDVVMILEFLHSFGPLFNIREVIREGITFGEDSLCDWRRHVLDMAHVTKQGLSTSHGVVCVCVCVSPIASVWVYMTYNTIPQSS